MLKVKNGNIYLNRGESASLKFSIWNTDGSPFRMPAMSNDICLRALCDITERSDEYVYSFHQPLFVMDEAGITITLESAGTASVYMKTLTDNTHSVEYHGSDTYTVTAALNRIVKIVTNKKIRSIKYNTANRLITDNFQLPALVFTVRAGKYDDIVLCKVLNMYSYITQNGITDYTLGGWSKFTTSQILERGSFVDLNEALRSDPLYGRSRLGKVGDNYYHVAMEKTGSTILKPYSFDIILPLDSKDTENLEPKEYTYDLIAYYGYVDSVIFNNDAALYTDIQWKKELVKPHKFIIGDSNNA